LCMNCHKNIHKSSTRDRVLAASPICKSRIFP
jgi:DNA-directed RNA polymerase subunit RPC12/RpoP